MISIDFSAILVKKVFKRRVRWAHSQAGQGHALLYVSAARLVLESGFGIAKSAFKSRISALALLRHDVAQHLFSKNLALTGQSQHA